MKAQAPAEGILKRGDYGDSKFYQVVCSCGQEYHDHNFEVEAAETGVNVNVYMTVKTDYWSETIEKRYDIDSIYWQEIDWFLKDLVNGFVRRVKVTWELWTTGAVTAQTTIAMTEQQAINYAETLKSAVKDVKAFSKPKENTAAVRSAQEQDCV